jgi:arsenite methyltransferase
VNPSEGSRGAPTLPAFDELLSADDVKACCAAVYAHPGVRWLLGDELHPGGVDTTRRALDLIDVGPGDRLLDVASGAGTSVLLAARERGCSVVGIEYGEDAVEAAADAARDQGLDELVSFRHGDAEALPLGDGEFDAVLCECSLCTFAGKQQAVAEMRRVLKPSGRVALCDVVVERERLPAGLDGVRATIACVGDALSPEQYEELLISAGLRLTAVESRAADAARLARRVEDRLRGARLLGLDRSAGSPLTTDEAIEVVRSAQQAIADGTLGYTIFAARST